MATNDEILEAIQQASKEIKKLNAKIEKIEKELKELRTLVIQTRNKK